MKSQTQVYNLLIFSLIALFLVSIFVGYGYSFSAGLISSFGKKFCEISKNRIEGSVIVAFESCRTCNFTIFYFSNHTLKKIKEDIFGQMRFSGKTTSTTIILNFYDFGRELTSDLRKLSESFLISLTNFSSSKPLVISYSKTNNILVIKNVV